MANIYNCDPSDLVEKASEELKKIETIKAPGWADFVKTGMHKERPPASKDWWYIRAASILKQVYKNGPVGVSKLRTKYGGKKNRGVKIEHFYKASGNIIRKIMQQLEKEEFVKKDMKSVHKGRIITSKGKKFLDDIAKTISKAEVKVEKKEPEVKTETKEIIQKQAKPTATKETTPIKKETKPIENTSKKDEKPIQATPKTQ